MAHRASQRYKTLSHRIMCSASRSGSNVRCRIVTIVIVFIIDVRSIGKDCPLCAS